MAGAIITIGIGGAGVAVATRFLRNLATDLAPSQSHSGGFFERAGGGVLVPRAVFVDTDPVAARRQRDSLTGTSGPISVHPTYILSGKESASRCFSRAYQGVVDTRLPVILDRVRRLRDNATKVDGFVIVHSLCGGTGSGLAAKLAQQLAAEYPKAVRVSAALLPGYKADPSPLDAVNAALGLHTLVPNIDVCLLADNDALSKLKGRRNYTTFNRALGRALTNFALPIQEGKTTLAAVANHNRSTSTLPFLVLSRSDPKPQIAAKLQIREVLGGQGAFASYGPESWERPALSSLLVFRGSYKKKDSETAGKELARHAIEGNSSALSFIISRPETEAGRTMHGFTAHAGIGPMLDVRVRQPFKKLLNANAFTHQALADGIEPGTLNAAHASLRSWIQSYGALSA